LYDVDGKGRISPSDLKTMLGGVLRENGVTMTDSQLDVLVANTFKENDVSFTLEWEAKV
jgi:hypothetical protein